MVPGAGSGSAGQSVALNAHIDVVAPYFPPRVKGGTVFGRGACDDKGPAVSIVAALKVLSEVMPAGRAEVEPERGGDAGGRGGNRRQRLPLAGH